MNKYWKKRGFPWEHDPGPAKNANWASIFAQSPNYRKLGKDPSKGKEKFRWHFGPMFFRGRLTPNSVKVLIIGQEGAQDESLGRRSFVGGTGSRMQHFLNHLGITESYLFLNTFVYPIHGQYDEAHIKNLAQDPTSPILQHRHQILNNVLATNDLRLIVAVGTAAKQSVVSWVKSKGGSCPQNDSDVSLCTGGVLGANVKIVGVMHPGGAGQGGSVTAIKASFNNAISKIKNWLADDPNWLPIDNAATRNLDKAYTYSSAPIPFRDLPFGTTWRIGRGGTSSNRRDGQRSIQLFSAEGKYNGEGASISYNGISAGSPVGYDPTFGDMPYEPPNLRFIEYDEGPPANIAQLFCGGKQGLAWPDFKTLGVNAHESFGCGPSYRGRFSGLKILVYADQESHDDIFTGRALTGEGGQQLQAFLDAMGITESYLIIRTIPVDTLDLSANAVNTIVNNPQVTALHQAIFNEVISQNPNINLILSVGVNAQALVNQLSTGALQKVAIKSWIENDALNNWNARLLELQNMVYQKDITTPTFTVNGTRKMIPRMDLSYGTMCWYGSSGSRAQRAKVNGTNQLSNDYYKMFQPDWVYDLPPSNA